jgi:hypothetical protein
LDQAAVTRWSSAHKHRRRVSWRARRTAQLRRAIESTLRYAFAQRGVLTRADVIAAVDSLFPPVGYTILDVSHDPTTRRVDCTIAELPVYRIDVTA